ncbi:membrane protein [Chitinophaga cymbidii]|uniref:Membrane protein n=2 Tax=Chitinophaga cymbidii TaxID=1096750 RepID=A0A512RPM5_9BACT|nr:membrane protein [Chitinophaga cymbidii]
MIYKTEIMSTYINKGIVTIICILAILMPACKKFVTVGEQETAMGEKATFEKEQTATAALLDVYSSVYNMFGSTGGLCLTKINAMYADEYTLTNTDASLMQLHTNSLDAVNIYVRGFWNGSYTAIYKINAVLENIEKYGSAIPAASRDQLTGEARFLRAFSYLLLVNVYGDVPVLLTPDYRQNMKAARTPRADVYKQIIADLQEAEKLLNAGYLDDKNVPGAMRLRPNKDVATALLARVYLYNRMWEEAEKAATTIINKHNVYALETDPGRVFSINSKEAIHQMATNNRVAYPGIAIAFELTGAPTTTGAGMGIGVLSNSLLSRFEPGDNRRSAAWVGTSTANGNTYYFPHKYRSGTVLTQYFTTIRLAEMYLIRAEAFIQQDQVENGVADLNVIRRRARAQADAQVPDPLPDLSLTLAKKEALLAVEQERRVELFMEGHRWFDLKRWNGIENPAVSRAEELMPAITTAKGGSWESYKMLFPLPQNEVLLNTNLEQNDEY